MDLDQVQASDLSHPSYHKESYRFLLKYIDDFLFFIDVDMASGIITTHGVRM